MTDLDLDRMLAEARANTPAPGADFMARLLADAVAEQPKAAGALLVQAAPAAVAPPAGLGARLWAALTAGFGGSATLAGLCGVALLGVWVGYADPAGLADSFVTTTDAGLELAPAAEYFLTGG